MDDKIRLSQKLGDLHALRIQKVKHLQDTYKAMCSPILDEIDEIDKQAGKLQAEYLGVDEQTTEVCDGSKL